MTKKKIIVCLVIVLLGGWFMLHKAKVESVKSKDSTILLSKSDVITVKPGTVASVVAFTGDLEPLNQAVISAEVDAQAKKVLVNEGQFVQKDQILAILDDTDLSQAVGEQKAILTSVEAKFNLDKQKLESQKVLYEKGFISKMAYDELIANYSVSGDAITQQKASLERAQKQLSNTVIKAPFAGYIYQKNIEVGQLASKNGKLFSLASLTVMQIKAAIPSDEINNIKIGQNVTFKVETSADSYVGKITRVNTVAETGTRAYLIYINFDNSKALLKAGQFVKGQVVLRSQDNIPYVPGESIHHATTGDFVYVLSKDRVEAKPVQVLITNTMQDISGVSGLVAGDVVIAGNVLSLKTGDKAKLLD